MGTSRAEEGANDSVSMVLLWVARAEYWGLERGDESLDRMRLSHPPIITVSCIRWMVRSCYVVCDLS